MREKSSGKPWYKNHVRNLEVASLLVVATIGAITYFENGRLKQQAHDQTEKLNADIGTLRDQNRTLGDQIGDCNARIEAVTSKLHAPAHLKRAAPVTLKLKVGATAERNKK
jgi:hypothetical protein